MKGAQRTGWFLTVSIGRIRGADRAPYPSAVQPCQVMVRGGNEVLVQEGQPHEAVPGDPWNGKGERSPEVGGQVRDLG